MDLKQLRFLTALQQTRHFGQAAERCHVTQPTLSMRLRQLEDELGLELVRRGSRFEGFTAEGERILAWAHSLLAAQDGLFAEAAACRGQLVGQLRLGVVPLGGFDPARLLALYASEHPHLNFQLATLSSEQILERLSRNQLDLGLCYLDRLDDERFEQQALISPGIGLLHDPQRFALPDAALQWQDLAGLPLGLLGDSMHFRQSVDHGLRSASLSPQPWLETDSVHSLLQMTAAGLCCALVPLDHSLTHYGSGLRLRPIAGAHTLAPLGLVMRRSAPRSALAEACFRLTASQLPHLQAP